MITTIALLGLSYWASGDLEAAHESFSGGIFQTDHDRIIGTFVLADMKVSLGRLRNAVRTCENALRLAAEHDPPLPRGTEDVYSAISELHREQGDLEAAAQALETAREQGERIDLPDWQYRWCIAQARLNETRGDLDGAILQLDEAQRVFVRTPLPIVRPIAAMKTRVWVRQGQLAEALDWGHEVGLSAGDDLSYLREFEHITLARVLLARYAHEADDTIDEARGLLDRLLHAAEAGKRMRSVIEILVLQALAFQAGERRDEALPVLERALGLAEPDGFFRIFVDEGPQMARLLLEAAAQGIAPEYTRRLLEACPVVDAAQAANQQKQVDQSDMLEPLSARELEVLTLIGEGLSNEEVGSRLFISTHTVRTHTRTIYAKLDVHSRTAAIAKARAFGLLRSG